MLWAANAEMLSILDISDTLRLYLKPCFSFSQTGRADYFADPLLPSSLAKKEPDTKHDTLETMSN